MTKKYTYSNNDNVRRISLLMSALFGVGGLLSLCLCVLSLFNFGYLESSYASTLFWNFIGFGIWSPIFFIFLAYANSDIEVEEEGLRVNFLLKSLLVIWDDIEEVKSGKTLGMLNLKKVRVLVTKNSLTPFHRLYGLMYGATNKPSLLIGTNISNCDDLFRIIEVQRKENRYK